MQHTSRISARRISALLASLFASLAVVSSVSAQVQSSPAPTHTVRHRRTRSTITPTTAASPLAAKRTIGSFFSHKPASPSAAAAASPAKRTIGSFFSHKPASPSAAAVAASPGRNIANATSPRSPVSPSTRVWVNTKTGVYHNPGTRWYGKTAAGKYMTAAEAARAGYRPAQK